MTLGCDVPYLFRFPPVLYLSEFVKIDFVYFEVGQRSQLFQVTTVYKCFVSGLYCHSHLIGPKEFINHLLIFNCILNFYHCLSNIILTVFYCLHSLLQCHCIFFESLYCLLARKLHCSFQLLNVTFWREGFYVLSYIPNQFLIILFCLGYRSILIHIRYCTSILGYCTFSVDQLS